MKAGRFHDGTWICFKYNGIIFINGNRMGHGILLEFSASSVRLDPPPFHCSERFVELLISAGERHPCEQRLDVEQSWVSPHGDPSTAEPLIM